MQPNVFEDELQQTMSWTGLDLAREQHFTSTFQQLSIFNTRRADGLARATAETPINVTLKSRRLAWQASLSNRSHQVDAPARPIILVASYYVSWASFQTQAAVNASK